MTFQLPQLVSETTGQPVPPLDWQSEGARIRIANLPPFEPTRIQGDEWSIWRYAAMLPVERQFSLGEGRLRWHTPLSTASRSMRNWNI